MDVVPVRSNSICRADRERGAVLVLGAALMVVLLAFAALGVDIANARQQRREAQNGADAAALAAAQDLPDMAAAVTTAKDYAQRNFAIPPTAWRGCRDADKLTRTFDTANDNQCISFNDSQSRVRVRLPTRQVPTFFGGAVGLRSLNVSADAVAGAVTMSNDRIVPAAVSGPLGTGLLCVEQSGNDMPCASRERGQFGSLSSPRLNIFKPTTNVDLTSLAISYAMNLDHNIAVYSALPAVCDGLLRSPCTTTNSGTGGTANHVLALSGNAVPPVTEGYVTGFMAETTDMGPVNFCGRLQRPDVTATNALVPNPGGCTTPGAPTTNILGRTVNGRHVYYWLSGAARQLFYPEVVALGYPDTDQRLAIGATVYENGDRRLDCFMAGYRYDAPTQTEILPNCAAAGVTYPTGGGTNWSRSVLDSFNVASYNQNNGTAAWLGPWTEEGDDRKPAAGKVWITGGALRLTANSGTAGVSVTRAIDMREPVSGQLATAARLTYSVNPQLDKGAIVVLEASTNGTTWTPIDTFNKTTGRGWRTRSVSFNGFISSNTRIRARITAAGDSAVIDFDDIQVTYSGTSGGQTPQIAPIFRTGLERDPRWGVIPRISYWPNPNAAPIEGFWGFFGYTSYVSNSKVKAFDAWVFDTALVRPNPEHDNLNYGFTPSPVTRLLE